MTEWQGHAARGRKAVIIGGSLGGLFAALMLRRAGWDVEVHERIGIDLAGRGAGIVTHPELFACLDRLGLALAGSDLGVRVSGRRVLDRQGAVVASTALPQVLTSWSRLYRLLRDALPEGCYHSGKALTEVEVATNGVVARFADGSVSAGDLLVGADGLFSTVRAQFLPEERPAYVGYVAWRGLAEESALSAATREALFDHFAFCLPPGEQMLGYPVAGTDENVSPGHRRYNFVWYRPAEASSALGDLLTDVDGVRQELSIAPHRIRPDVVGRMREASEALLAPAFAEVVRETRQPFLQPIVDFGASRMRLAPRVAIIGDAAFVARPHVGMGVTKAASDAAALADALEREPDIDAALHAFAARRQTLGTSIIRRARHLGAYMQAQALSAEERAMAERHRSPIAVMTETAVAGGIAA